jgi:hypothetical protein
MPTLAIRTRTCSAPSDRAVEQIIDSRQSGSHGRGSRPPNEMKVPTALAERQWYPSTARNAALAYERDLVRASALSQ